MKAKNKDIKEGKKVMPTFGKKCMAVSDDSYKEWFGSTYYDQLYSQHDDAEAATFLSRLINLLEPPAGSFVLESACGNGRHAKTLASYGLDVTGVDFSFKNIDEAMQWESEHIHFFQHDLRLPFWMNYFHYVFNLFTRFGHFRSAREHSNVIRTIANSLKPGGYLVMDHLNVHYAEDNLVPEAETMINGVNFHLSNSYDDTHFYKKIIVEDDQSDKPLVFQEKLAKFSFGEFNELFSFHHLQVQEVFGDYQLNSYDLKKSPRLVLIAKKR